MDYREQEYESIINNIKNNRGGGRLGYHYTINLHAIATDDKITKVIIIPKDYNNNNQGHLEEFYNYLNRFINDFTDLGLNIGFSNIEILDFSAPTSNFTSLHLERWGWFDEPGHIIDLTNYQNINDLEIICNQPIIRGLDKLTKLKKLKMLNKSTELPAEIKHMHELNSLILGEDNINKKDCNNITKLPDFISSLPIEELNICNNKLQKIPTQLKKIKTLKELNLGYNYISKLPEDFNELINLKKLRLHHNNFTKYPRITLEMPNLDELDLGSGHYGYSDNKITELPSKMNSKLKSLDLSDNNIFDISPLNDLKEIEILNLYSNDISIIPEGFYLPKIKEMNLSCNKLRTIPLWFKEIKELSINCNNFYEDIEGPCWSVNEILNNYKDDGTFGINIKEYKSKIKQVIALNESSSTIEIKKALNEYPHPGAVKRILHNLSDKLTNYLESDYLNTKYILLRCLSIDESTTRIAFKEIKLPDELHQIIYKNDKLIL